MKNVITWELHPSDLFNSTRNQKTMQQLSLVQKKVGKMSILKITLPNASNFSTFKLIPM